MRDKEIDPREVGLEFLRAELAAGASFAQRAADAGRDEGKRQRNLEHAETAHSALLKFLPRLKLTADEAKELADGIEDLRRAIAAIPRA